MGVSLFLEHRAGDFFSGPPKEHGTRAVNGFGRLYALSRMDGYAATIYG